MVRDEVKRASPSIVRRAAEVSVEHFWEVFEEATLVPVPRSARRLDEDTLWPSLAICEKLLEHGLGTDIHRLLKRVRSLHPAHLSAPGGRADIPEQVASLSLEADVLTQPKDTIVLVDDIVTSGTTLLACREVIWRGYPDHNVDAFAVMRSMSDQVIEEVLAPAHCHVTRIGDRGRRRP